MNKTVLPILPFFIVMGGEWGGTGVFKTEGRANSFWPFQPLMGSQSVTM
jgi:hypothetical protein